MVRVRCRATRCTVLITASSRTAKLVTSPLPSCDRIGVRNKYEHVRIIRFQRGSYGFFQKHRRPDFQCGAKRRGLARFQQSSVNHRKKHRHRRREHRARPKLCIGWHSTRPGTICPRTGQEASRRTDGNDLREPQRATQRWHRARRLGRRFGRAGPRWHNFHNWRGLNSCGKHSCCGDGRRRRPVRDGH